MKEMKEKGEAFSLSCYLTFDVVYGTAQSLSDVCRSPQHCVFYISKGIVLYLKAELGQIGRQRPERQKGRMHKAMWLFMCYKLGKLRGVEKKRLEINQVLPGTVALWS